MKPCRICDDTSPDDALYCIGCGNKFEQSAYTKETTRLSYEYKPSVLPSGAKYIPNSFVGSGQLYPFAVENQVRYPGNDFDFVNISGDFYIKRSDLLKLVRDKSTYVDLMSGDIYYYGRKVQIIEDE